MAMASSNQESLKSFFFLTTFITLKSGLKFIHSDFSKGQMGILEPQIFSTLSKLMKENRFRLESLFIQMKTRGMFFSSGKFSSFDSEPLILKFSNFQSWPYVRVY